MSNCEPLLIISLKNVSALMIFSYYPSNVIVLCISWYAEKRTNNECLEFHSDIPFFLKTNYLKTELAHLHCTVKSFFQKCRIKSWLKVSALSQAVVPPIIILRLMWQIRWPGKTRTNISEKIISRNYCKGCLVNKYRKAFVVSGNAVVLRIDLYCPCRWLDRHF